MNVRHVLLGTALLASIFITSTAAQEPPASQQERTLRPGDKITWTPGSGHRLQLGGSITVDGKKEPLTPFADVEKILKDFSPALTNGPDGAKLGPIGTAVTATVKDDAAKSEFFFTCGIPPHSAEMVTVPLLIEPPAGTTPAHMQISAKNPPPQRRWILATTSGDRMLTRPKQ